MPNYHAGQVALYLAYRLGIEGVFYDKCRGVHGAVSRWGYEHPELPVGQNCLIAEPLLYAGIIVDKTGGHHLTVFPFG